MQEMFNSKIIIPKNLWNSFKKEDTIDVILLQFFLANQLSKNLDIGINIRLGLINSYFDLVINIGQYDKIIIINDLFGYMSACTRKYSVTFQICGFPLHTVPTEITEKEFTFEKKRKIIDTGNFLNQYLMEKIIQVHEKYILLIGYAKLVLHGRREDICKDIIITKPVTLYELMSRFNELKMEKFLITLTYFISLKK
jgi:hypothetical protein